MTKDVLTPCAALFDMMKRYGGINYKDLAALILSGKPLMDGVSPVSRINDRTWLSRFVVHAPVGSIQEGYFADLVPASLRVAARLKANKRKSLTNGEILDLVTDDKGEEMLAALKTCHQDVSLYKNICNRLQREAAFTENERAELAVVLLVSAGCTADVRKAAAEVIEFAKTIHGAGVATPLVTPEADDLEMLARTEFDNEPLTLVLIRVVDGYVVGNNHWLDPALQSIEIGSLALGEGAITDVGPDVSGKHLLLTYEDGDWYAQGLGSKFGTILVSGADHSEIVIEPPRSQNGDAVETEKVRIQPGDELLLASNTRFLVMGGGADSLTM